MGVEETVVKKGLRKRIQSRDNAGSGLSQAKSHTTSSSSQLGARITGSPLDRLADLILSWDLNDLATGNGTFSNAQVDNSLANKTEDSTVKAHNRQHMNISPALQIPTRFSNFDEYLEAYEPLMLQELQANIRSSLAAATIQSQRRGWLHVGEADNESSSISRSTTGKMSTHGSTVRLSATPAAAPPVSNAAAVDIGMETDGRTKYRSGDKDGPSFSSMELLLLTLEPPSRLPVDSAFLAQCAAATAAGTHSYALLALVISSQKGGVMIKVFQRSWHALLAILRSNKRIQSRQAKDCKPSPTAATEFEKVSASKEGVSVPLNRNGKRGIQHLEPAAEDNASAMERATKKTNPASSSGLTKIDRTNALLMHYTILDQLTSPWREYLALYEICLNKSPLAKHVLGCPTPAPPTAPTAPTAEPAGILMLTSQRNEEEEMPPTPPLPPWDEQPLINDMAFTEDPLGESPSSFCPQEPESPPPSPPLEADTPPPSPPPEQPANPTLLTLPTTAGKGPTESCPELIIPGISATLHARLTSLYNKSQLIAIAACVAKPVAGQLDQAKQPAADGQEAGFVLVQGPPGTGKTSTIVGMLNTMHVQEYDKVCPNPNPNLLYEYDILHLF